MQKMFTGLIQHVGTLRSFAPVAGGGARLSVDVGALAAESKLGDSIAIDGCCLTVTELNGTTASFDAVPETLRRTTLGGLQNGSRVNLECAMLPATRLGGHFVQGHVDTTATLESKVEGGRWVECHFKLADAAPAPQIVEKGSIAVDGISLTVAGCGPEPGQFWVTLIPETLARTTLGERKKGQKVNIETDILGKYVHAALMSRLDKIQPVQKTMIDENWLRENGYK